MPSSTKFCREVSNIWHTFFCDKHIVVFESDDWGMCGVRDKEAINNLRKKGYDLPVEIDDNNSLETEEDLLKLYDVLLRHVDSVGNHPVFTFNFIVTNPDFDKISKSGYKTYHYKKLCDGFPSKWSRKNLYQTYLGGIKRGIVYPGYHGQEHFNYKAWLQLLQKGSKSAIDLFHEQMVFGYRPIWNEIKGHYLDYDYDSQKEIVKDGVSVFRDLFGFYPLTTIAPTYIWSKDTEEIWAKAGIKFIQAGNQQKVISSEGQINYKTHYSGELNEWGMIYLTRNVSFELFAKNFDLHNILDRIDILFRLGEPVIISTHRINYTSSVKNFRDNSLIQLDRLLTSLEEKYSELLYLNDEQLGNVILKGYFIASNGEEVRIGKANSFFHNLKATITLAHHKVHDAVLPTY